MSLSLSSIQTRCSLTKSGQHGPCSSCKIKGKSCKPRQRASSSASVTETRVDAAPRPPPSTSALTKRTISSFPMHDVRLIDIAIDTGHDFTKAAVRIHYRDGQQEIQPTSLLAVSWHYLDLSVRTQIAFNKNGQMLWGDGVTVALKAGHIDENDVRRCFKPALFDGENYLDTDTQDLQVRLFRINRESQLSESLMHYGETVDEKRMDHIVLYSDYLRLVYQKVLHFISHIHGSLRWPSIIEAYNSFTPDVEIHVALPSPMASTQLQIQLIMAAARAAGIPNPSPVAEPSAALAYQFLVSPGQKILGKTFLILDIGAGTADLAGGTVLGLKPIRFREIEIPEHVKTSWCGGRFIDDAAVSLIMKDILCIDRVLRALETNHNPMTKKELGEELAKEFEKEKRQFTGSETLFLSLPGLPNIPEYRMRGGGRVVLQPGDVEKAFEVCMVKIKHMLDTALKAVTVERPIRGKAECQICKIIVTGGTTQSEYIRNRLRAEYSDKHPFIPIDHPPEAATGSITVSKGALMLLAEKELIKERIIRRSFCIAWFKEVDKKRYPSISWELSEHDHRTRVLVTKFLLPLGVVPQRYQRSEKGWRGLLSGEMDKSGQGWTIIERLYYSNTRSEDDIWIDEPGNDIHEMDNPLAFFICLEDARKFPPLREGLVDDNAAEGYYCDYELVLKLDGDIMTFELFVPRSGRWSTIGHRYGLNPIHQLGQYDNAGVFHLFNSA